MAKRKRKPSKIIVAKKICEQCGNGGRTKKAVFKCKYCGYINGLGTEVLITKGSIEDR